MKIALLTYHSNVQNLYPKHWIDQYRISVQHQTFKDFAIFEMNYGGDDFRIFPNSYFESVKMPSFVYALNYLLDKCFTGGGYDYVFNTNVDDIMTIDRIEKQLPYLKDGYDIVSANFALMQDEKVVKYHKFHEMNIAVELSHNHNIVAHPSVAYSAAFWKKHRYVPEQCPLEDMMLWQRAIKDSKIIILKENLLFHRIHQNAVCRSDNR